MQQLRGIRTMSGPHYAIITATVQWGCAVGITPMLPCRCLRQNAIDGADLPTKSRCPCTCTHLPRVSSCDNTRVGAVRNVVQAHRHATATTSARRRQPYSYEPASQGGTVHTACLGPLYPLAIRCWKRFVMFPNLGSGSALACEPREGRQGSQPRCQRPGGLPAVLPAWRACMRGGSLQPGGRTKYSTWSPGRKPAA